MIAEKETLNIPRTFEEFMNWESSDGFKYEWNDGELIKFTGMKQQQWYVYDILTRFFVKKGYLEIGNWKFNCRTRCNAHRNSNAATRYCLFYS